MTPNVTISQGTSSIAATTSYEYNNHHCCGRRDAHGSILLTVKFDLRPLQQRSTLAVDTAVPVITTGQLQQEQLCN